MDFKTARGFLMLSLNSDQITQIRSKELSYPQGRYLTPWEICKLLGTSCGSKTEVEVAQMEELENKWNHQLWKQRKIEELGEMKAKSDQEEMHDWDDFVMQNWDHTKELSKDDY